MEYIDKSWRNLFKFLMITFVLTWCFGWGAMAVFKVSQLSPLGNVMHIFAGLGPMFAAYFCLKDRSWSSIKNFLFRAHKGSWVYLLLFLFLQVLIIALSSREASGLVDETLLPILFIQASLIGGGNEEPGWRGVMQPILETKLPFFLASLVTGLVWAVWHLPLWFIEGSIQQTFPFYQFTLYAILLSFIMAAIYRQSGSVFYCSIFHGLNNVLIVYFVLKINGILLTGLVLLLLLSIILSKYNNKQEFL